MLIALNFNHLPSEEDLNTSFLALIESYFISVWELVNLLVRCPILNFGILSGTTLELVLAEEVLVVESVEV